MDTVSSIRDMINLWDRRLDLVDDMCAASSTLSVTIHQVNKWAEKGSIPPKYHYSILKCARAREFEVDADLIVELHAPGMDAA